MMTWSVYRRRLSVEKRRAYLSKRLRFENGEKKSSWTMVEVSLVDETNWYG